MRIFLFLFSLFSFAMIASAATEEPTMCTMEYAPVCGEVQVQCIMAPCYPVRETFGNACMAAASHATNITQGECEATPTKQQALVTWAHDNALTRYADVGDFGYDRALSRQEAGAIVARAGTDLWNLRYASYPDVCNVAYTDEASFDLTLKNDIYSACAYGLMRGQGQRFSPTRTLSRAEALAIIMRGVDGGKKDESGALWYSRYAERAQQLGILSVTDGMGLDNAITRGEFVEWMSLATHYTQDKSDSPLMGDWTLTNYNDTTITDTRYTLKIDSTSIAAKFCNNMFGSYSLSGSAFVVPAIASTMMYCEGLPMTLENAFVLDGASYSVVALRLAEGATGSTMQLNITTPKGDVYIYGQ